ncbi:general substrate transporter [Aspergillus piperis CBS 112811]|uniref:General substrate transporter n=1 Tax=Aspergillus piperis CBS 112811 TaxID=1448313 RepID=A0A8G1QT24_9EURO|nr:general substrate transporter [Aspergillus piperis CBS 112811]RAH53133.1 general substrate transporter [Aspergillus piperis CBS 112811]
MALHGHALSLAQLILVVCPAFFLFGYNQAGVGGLVSVEDWTTTFPEIDTIHTSGAVKSHNLTVQGVVISTFTLGALVGSLSCSLIGDILGRRKVIFAGSLATLIGEALCCSSFGLAQLIVGRLIIGIGIGMLSGTVPVWQSECSSAHNRGKHVVLDGLFISAGYAITSWVNLGLYQVKTGSVAWRVPLAIPGLVSLIPMFSIFFLPESPRWLVQKGRLEQARTTLVSLSDASVRPEDLNGDIAAIQSILESHSRGVSIMDIWRPNDEKLLFRFALCIMLQFYQQMSGGNLISVYAPVIFEDNLQMTSMMSRILAAATLSWKFFSCFVAFYCVDRFGRRVVFIVSGSGMSLCMLALAITTSFPHTNKPASIISALFIFLFNFFIPIGFLGANFLYCTEVAPLRLRVAMASISTANHWLWNFVVTMITPVAINNIGYQYYIVYAVIGACIPISVYFLYPETMGWKLEDLDILFKQGLSIRGIVRSSYRPRNCDAEGRFSLEKSEVEEVEHKDL